MYVHTYTHTHTRICTYVYTSMCILIYLNIYKYIQAASPVAAAKPLSPGRSLLMCERQGVRERFLRSTAKTLSDRTSLLIVYDRCVCA